MSENFEKAVLKKLESIESNQQITNERLDKLENNQQDIYQRLSNLEFNQIELSGKTSAIHLEQNNIKRKLNTVILNLKKTQDVVEFNTSRIIELEQTFKDKIDALFDFRSINDDKHKQYEYSINDLDTKVFKLDVRTSILEENAKIVSNT